MKNFPALLCAITLVAAVQPLVAQDSKTAEITAVSKGQRFAARLTLQTSGQKPQFLYHYAQDDSKPVKIGTLNLDTEYKIRPGAMRFGWPQEGVLIVLEGDKEVLRTQPTYEPVTIQLKAGQSLRVEFVQEYEPYDARTFKVKGINCAIVLPRPYWYQDVEKGVFKGPEPYPNSLFFLVDDQWGFGEKRCLDDLATLVSKELKTAPDGKEDFRVNHVSVNIAHGPDGKHRQVLTDLPEAELKAEMLAGLTKAWSEMKQFKCYRPFDGQSGAPIAALKDAGYLPKDWAADRTYISFAEALELAKEGAKKWREANPERMPGFPDRKFK